MVQVALSVSKGYALCLQEVWVVLYLCCRIEKKECECDAYYAVKLKGSGDLISYCLLGESVPPLKAR